MNNNANITPMNHQRLTVFRILSLAAVMIIMAALTTTTKSQGSSNSVYLPSLVSQPTGFAAVPMGDNFSVVTAVTHAGDDRLFIAEQPGRIKILHPDGRITIFLDITSRVISNRGEYGFYDVDFHPGYADPSSPGYGYFYVMYTTGYDIDFDHRDVHTIVSRFHVSADPDVADPTSETIYMQVTQSFDVHKGGGMDFDRDTDMLYIGVGEDRLLLVAQDDKTPKGKVVRLDVNDPLAKPEIWGYGFRNPWRLDVDELGKQIYVGDVGDSLWEEVDLMPLGLAGYNYGWPCMEGPYRIPEANEIQMLPQCKRGFELPIYNYEHRDGSGRCAIIGGYVYRPDFNINDNRYIFGDLCTREIASIYPVNGVWERTPIAQLEDLDPLSTFGEDRFGNIYLGTLSPSGPIYRLYLP